MVSLIGCGQAGGGTKIRNLMLSIGSHNAMRTVARASQADRCATSHAGHKMDHNSEKTNPTIFFDLEEKHQRKQKEQLPSNILQSKHHPINIFTSSCIGDRRAHIRCTGLKQTLQAVLTMAFLTTRSNDVKSPATRWLERTCDTLKEGKWCSERPVIYNGADFKGDDDATFTIFDAIQRNGGVRTITLKNAKLNAEELCVLATSFSKNPSLHKLTLSNISSPPDLLEASLANLKDLNSLTLHKVKVNSKLSVIVQSMIQSGALKTLILDQVDITDDVEELFESISESGITHLAIRNIRVHPKYFSYLFDCQKSNSVLECLEVNRCGLCSETAHSLAGLISSAKNLTTLDVSENNIDEVDVEALTTYGLQSNASLKKLIFSHNPIGDAGAAILADWLCENCTLQSLSIVDCEIWGSGCKSFGRALRQMRGIRNLVVDSEFENYAGVVLESMKWNMSLLKLRIHGLFDRDDPKWQQVDFYLKLNRSKRRFLLEGDVSASLWPRILSESSCDASVLFYMLKHKPDLARR